MHFAKLRLSGFKSFVEQTELSIEPGLTGIVGPNGCGKSNLVEALRWVMGENRVKQMRGGEMDDVIFAGTTSRPPRNIAEVSLLVDNNTRNAPAAYNDQVEFDIVRRIERGQGSAYRIGGRDVRARDVQLLFADVATGAHSPALVSQGRIGAIIQAKPTDRRSLLEEAAGITGLRSRRHEAELKLKAAEANLARLDDVLTTLDAQHQTLKKQAKQAARYRNMSDLIRRAEAVSLHLAWSEATAHRDDASTRFAAAEATVNEIAGRAAHAATGLANAQSLLPDLRKAEAEAAARLARLGLAREQLDAEEQRIQEALAQIEARLVQVKADEAREQAQAADAEQALARLAAERADIEAADVAAAETAETVGRDLNTARAEVEELDTALALATEAVAKTEAELASLKREIGELTGRTERLEIRLNEARAERAKLDAAALEFDPQLRAGEEKVAAVEATLAAARAEQEAIDVQLRATQEEENGAREALRKAEAELARIDAEATALEAVLKSAAAHEHTPVLDKITVAAGYETALGAALGEDLSAPLDADAPMHWRIVDSQSHVPSLPSGVEPLASHVTAPEALSRRLAQIGVVENEAQGAELSRLLAQGQRLVSRDGALWRWDGFTVRDLGRMGGAAYAAGYIDSNGGIEPLVMNVEPNGGKGYHSVLIVRADSPYKKLEDLKGKTLAWADPNSTSGFLVPNAALRDAGIDPQKFFGRTLFSGGHEQNVLGVLKGNFDSAFTWTSPGHQSGQFRIMMDRGMLKLEDLRIVWESPLIANPLWAIPKNIPADMRKDLQNMFVNLAKKDMAMAEAAAQGKTSGFEPVSHETYKTFVTIAEDNRKQRRK